MARILIFSGYNERAVVALCRELTALARPFSIIASGGRDAIFRTTYRSHVSAIRTVTALDADDIDRCLRRAQAAHPDDRWVIAPSSEFLNQHVLAHREWFAARRCEIPLVDESCYSQVTNKQSFRALCERAGIAVPPLVDPHAGRFPFVAKPRTNISADGRSLYPALIHSADDWARQGDRLGSFDDYYFEALIDGSSHYLLYYLPVDASAPAFRWSQRNLLQQPNGKSMLLAVSDTVHTEPISQRVIDMLRGIGFSGLAMVEVIRHHDEYVAIEMNPRLWGPLQLLRNAGTYLIRAFVEDALDGRVTSADPAAGHPASYLWLGGLRAGMTWHCPPPRFPFLWLAPKLGGDVYLQRDTVGLFIDECVRRTA